MPKQSSKSVVSEQVITKAKEVIEMPEDNEVDEGEIDTYVTPEQFDLSKFHLNQIEEKLSKGSQYLAFPKYKYGKKKDNPLTIVTGNIKLSKGGIPRLDGEYKKTDGDRMFFWLGCDNEQKSCVELFNILRQIDEHYQEQLSKNSETKFAYLSKDSKKEPLDKLEYVGLVRESTVPENAEKKVEPFDRIKVKFNTTYDKDLPEGQVADITTSLFVGEREEPENLVTVTDFEKFLRWNCEAKFVFQVNKFWAMKAVKNKKRECGLSIKCLQVYITKEAPVSGVNASERFKKRLFGGSFGKPQDETRQTQSKPETREAEPTKQESDDSESSSSEEEPKTTKETKPSKQVANDSESSEEESDEEDKEDAKEETEESEESESEDSPPPPPKKGQQTNQRSSSKKKQSTEESDSSEEKPKQKNKNAKK